MKKIVLIAGTLVAINTVKAQHLTDAEVPVQVKEAFTKKYPGAKAEWEKKGFEYEAEFKLSKTKSSAIFDGKGTFKALEEEVKITALPKTAVDYCAKNFVGYKLVEAAKITEATGEVIYEAELKKGTEEFDALFSDKGNFIKKSETSTK